MNIVNTQLSRIHILLNKMNRMAYKVDYVVEITNGRESSTKCLSFDEANALIKKLEQDEREMNKQVHDRADSMRKKIIGCCRQMGWEKGGRADMQRINAWVLKYGYLHKELMKYTNMELPTLVTQAAALRDSTLKGLR